MEPIISIRDLSYKYYRSDDYAIMDVNLDVNRGEFVAIMGPTGAGKSTLCLTLNGSIPKILSGTFKGTIIVNSLNTLEETVQKLASQVGIVFQNPNLQLFCFDVESELAFGPENLGVEREEIRRRIREVVKLLRLEGLEKRSPAELSGGQKQAVAIGAALTMNPVILVLDEPTSNLDPIGTKQIFEILKRLKSQKDITVVMVSHKSEEIAEFVDRVVIMDKGKITLNDIPHRIFEQKIVEEKKYIRPPQVSEAIYKLKQRGYKFDKTPVTLEEAYKIIKEYLEKNNVKKKEPIPISEEKATKPIHTEKEPIIRVRNLWHIYKGNVVAIKNVNFDIYPGEFVAIIGQNGAGKTTLVKHFNALLKPTKGFVMVKDYDTRVKRVSELSKYVGYIYQNPDDQLFAESVEDEVAFGPRNMGLSEEEVEKIVTEILENLHLSHLRKEHPISLSLGDRHRVAVASVLAMKPEVIILDEPTTGQDFMGSREIVSLTNELNKQGKTIIMITHDMYLVAEYAHRVIVLSQGEILLDGSPREVFSKPEILAQTFIEPPQITKLSQKLGDFGFPPGILTVDEFCDVFGKIVSGGA